jgi:hypothetical protein
MMTVNGPASGQAALAIASGNRNSFGKPLKPSGQRDWSFGVFECFGACGTFTFACCCPWFAYAKNTSRLRHLESQGTVHPAGGDMVRSTTSDLLYSLTRPECLFF